MASRDSLRSFKKGPQIDADSRRLKAASEVGARARLGHRANPPPFDTLSRSVLICGQLPYERVFAFIGDKLLA
ncbi:hypothetical protein [Salinisphaera sp. C84B14]|uniref:hypothetical protein n=1 Tax=Salinisphaera sp. C84B14 TaxID=1304155 RepID=UPI0033412295